MKNYLFLLIFLTGCDYFDAPPRKLYGKFFIEKTTMTDFTLLFEFQPNLYEYPIGFASVNYIVGNDSLMFVSVYESGNSFYLIRHEKGEVFHSAKSVTNYDVAKNIKEIKFQFLKDSIDRD